VPEAPALAPRADGLIHPSREADTCGHENSPVTPWSQAYATARDATTRRRPVVVPLQDAIGSVTAGPLVAAGDLPSSDRSAMDGWVVAGAGPWVALDGLVSAGRSTHALAPGEAMQITTGGHVPHGAHAVLRWERARHEGRVLSGAVVEGTDVRPRGQEFRTGDLLAQSGTPVTPVVVGIAAAAGHETLVVTCPPTVDLLVVGDELIGDRPPAGAASRDALGPMLPGWFRSCGAVVRDVAHLPDSAAVIRATIEGSDADVVVTTGGTSRGATDHVRPALRDMGATMLVGSVAVRPGHPMLMARTPAGRLVIGLPGNPLAAVAGVVTLVEPVLRVMSGRHPAPTTHRRMLSGPPAHPTDTLLVPVCGDEAVPFIGPAMLRGLAVADGLAVVPPGHLDCDMQVLTLPR